MSTNQIALAEKGAEQRTQEIRRDLQRLGRHGCANHRKAPKIARVNFQRDYSAQAVLASPNWVDHASFTPYSDKTRELGNLRVTIFD